jgi:hypothetical protein
MVVVVEADDLPATLAHPKKPTYPKQMGPVVTCDGDAYLVPFVEQKDRFFIKTIILSRKAKPDQLSQGDQDGEFRAAARETASKACRRSWRRSAMRPWPMSVQGFSAIWIDSIRLALRDQNGAITAPS